MENVSKIWSFISSMESPRFGSSTRGSNSKFPKIVTLEAANSPTDSNLPIWKRGLMAGNTTCDDKIRTYAILPTTTLLETLQTTRCGLSQQEAAHRLEVGSNTLSSRKPPKWWQLLLRVIPSYFNILLVIIAIIAILCIPREWKTFGVILCMILASCLLQFIRTTCLFHCANHSNYITLHFWSRFTDNSYSGKNPRGSKLLLSSKLVFQLRYFRISSRWQKFEGCISSHCIALLIYSIEFFY